MPFEVLRNIDFARANLKINIHDQAVLEGVATSFHQTEEIIENGKVNGVSVSDVLKILNLKHARVISRYSYIIKIYKNLYKIYIKFIICML